jgi:hypothetical protein
VKTVDHLFFYCSIASCLLAWIASYNNFNFNCEIIEDLWFINAFIPYKDENICKMLRGAILWIIWNERNRLIFRGGVCKNIRALGSKNINLIKYWNQLKSNENIHLMVPPNVNSPPLQILEEQLRIGFTEVEQEVMYGEEIELTLIQ